jgi:tRNA threonylcarbamoyl adenosine modification protein YeaZ
MNILALDSSSPVTSVALVSFAGDEESVLFVEETPHARSDSSALFRALESAVGRLGKPDAICVGLGPGSYNGLRASIAASRGFATALGIPLHAVPSPLAIRGPSEGFHVCGDARGGHYWVASVRHGRFEKEPALVSPAEAALLMDSSAWPVFAAAPLAGIEDLRIATPSAVLLAALALRHAPVYVCPLTPEPLYLKPPHITVAKAAVSPSKP